VAAAFDPALALNSKPVTDAAAAPMDNVGTTTIFSLCQIFYLLIFSIFTFRLFKKFSLDGNQAKDRILINLF